MLSVTGLFLTLLVVTVPSALAAFCNAYYCDEDYCGYSSQYCKENTTHVGCLPNEFAPACGPNATVRYFPIYDTDRTNMIYMINQGRNNTAGGLGIGANGPLPIAVRMGYTTWNWSLAYTAMLQAKQCNLQGDQCHNTPSAPDSGQLVYYACGPIGSLDDTTIINNAFTSWLSTSAFTTSDIIASYKPDNVYYPFNLMMLQQNKAMGCSLITFQPNSTDECKQLVCNFAANTTEGCTVYTTGEIPRSDCDSFSRSHINLCDMAETYSDIICQNADFCSIEAADLCPESTHIACDSPVTSDPGTVTMTTSLKKSFLKGVNKCRNNTACIAPMATRMAETTWSIDLERSAIPQAVLCSTTPGDCHNSHSFPNSGQSVFVYNGSLNDASLSTIIQNAFDYWCSQQNSMDSSNIGSYSHSTVYDDYGNIADERNTRIGCSIYAGIANKICIVCNYATQPENGCPLYNKGKTRADCLTNSPTYSCLCGTDEFTSSSPPYTYDTSTCPKV